MAAFQTQAVARQIELAVAIDGFLPTVCGDVQRLGQVLNNLLDNALRHTPAGGVVNVCLSASNGAARLAVIDSGAGIAPSDLPHIFERFYRADSPRNRAQRARTGGSGLGLAIARQLVQAHGGGIWVESPPVGRDTGSAFVLELPVRCV